MRNTVLVASNDADFCIFIEHALVHGGFEASVIDPSSTHDTAVITAAKAILVENSHDIECILTFCRTLRAVPSLSPVPIMVMIGARQVGFYLSLMKAGADECILRPMAPELIISCLNKLIAKTDHERSGSQRGLHIGDLVTRDETRLVIGKVKSKQLSPTEYRLLRRLLENPGHVVSRAELIDAAWPSGRYVEPRTLDVHMGNLRRSMTETTGRAFIRTIRSNGFVAEIYDDPAYKS